MRTPRIIHGNGMILLLHTATKAEWGGKLSDDTRSQSRKDVRVCASRWKREAEGEPSLKDAFLAAGAFANLQGKMGSQQGQGQTRKVSMNKKTKLEYGLARRRGVKILVQEPKEGRLGHCAQFPRGLCRCWTSQTQGKEERNKRKAAAKRLKS